MLLTLLLITLGTQISKTQIPVASEPVDVVLLIDVSDALGRPRFSLIKSSVTRIINSLPIGPNKYRLALVQYSDDVHVEFHLDDFRVKNPMLNHLKKSFSFQGGSLRTGNAIQKVQETFFKAPRGERNQVLVVITSGVSEDDVEGPARLMKENGIKIIALGMHTAPLQQLQSMATHPFYYHFDTPKDLQKFSPNMFTLIESLIQIDNNKVISTTAPPSVNYTFNASTTVADCSDDSIADVAFVVDEAVSPADSEHLLAFLQNTANSLDVQKDCIKIGLVTYSTEPHLLSQLNTETEKDDILQRLNHFSSRKGKANLGAALNFTRKIIFAERAGSRKTQGVEQITTIITHRLSDDNVTEAASLLLKEGVTVFAISLEGANITQLIPVVSYPPERNIIKVDAFSSLPGHFKTFQKKLFNQIHNKLYVQTGRREQLKSGCKETEKADIYFLIDGSSSISYDNFNKMKTFLKEVIKLFTVGPDHVRFGVVQYASSYRTEFELDVHTKSSHLEKAINNIIQMGIDTYTGAAIKSMKPLFEKAKNQRDSKIPCYLVVLTDGEAHDNVLEPSNMLRRSGVNIYAIGVKDANITQLHEIADSESKVYFVQQFDSLKNIKDEVVQDLCSKEACKEPKADVMFLVDSSWSTGANNFEKMKKFMQNMVNISDIGPDTVHVGVVQFSRISKEEFPLSSSKDYIMDTIGGMSLMNENTLTGGALQFVSNYFKPDKGARSSVNKILILITDGEAQDDVKTPADALRNEGIIIYSIGIFNANRTQLEEISGKPDKVFYVENFDILKSIQNDIMFRICSPFKPAECKKISRLDLVFVIDSSGSIGTENYKFMKDFIIGIVNKSDVSKDHVQFGALKYSEYPVTLFKLNTFTKKSEIIAAIQSDVLLQETTYTAKALQQAKELLTEANGSRKRQGVPQVLMVITDGESHDSEKLDEISKEIRDKQTTIFAVGIKNAKPDELQIMAGSQDHWFYVDTFTGLENISLQLSDKVCNISRPECNIKADLLILIDSRSISDKELENVKNFLKTLLNLIVYNNNILVGMAQFSEKYVREFQMGDYQNISELNNKITGVSLLKGNKTLIGHTLNDVKSIFKSRKNRAARNINQMLLIITDGKSSDDAAQPAKDLRDEGVMIHAVGIGSVNNAKLLQLTDSPNRKYTVASHSELDTIVKRINDEMCEEISDATCFMDILIGFDISSQKPGDNLFSKQPHLEAYLPDIIKGLTSLRTGSCSKGTKIQFNVAVPVQNTEPPLLATLQIDYENLIEKLKKVEVNNPSYLNVRFLDTIWNSFQSQTDKQKRNKVILLFSDGLDDNIEALEQKSEELRKQGLAGIVTIALEGAKDTDHLRYIEFGKGFGYNTQLFIDTQSIANKLFAYMDQIAERECCCLFCRCEGEEGPRAQRGGKGNKGITGVSGHHGYFGEDGEPGPRGIIGLEGKTGLRGDHGNRGEKGRSGRHGEKGEDGTDGINGIQGEEGSLGLPGLKGEKGDPGQMGSSGPRGPPGDFGLKGFPGDLGEPGVDNNIIGAKGFGGIQGSMGQRGLEGLEGISGSPGNRGAEGKRGLQGLKGEKGAPGPDGLQGNQGFQGSKGTAGILGTKGGKGQPGNEGLRGNFGVEGSQGDHGKTGARGNKGEMGDPGKKGEQGSPGQQGQRGEEGIVGFGNPGRKGSKGKEGCPGNPGIQGKRGDIGIPGEPGPKGYRGRMGSPGLNGDEGEPGSWGYPGHMGPKGAKGQPNFSPCDLIKYVQEHSPCWTGTPTCPAYPTELVFGLDASQDTTPQIFEQMREIIIEIVNTTTIREGNCPVGARVAVVSYSSNIDYLIRFSDFYRKNQLLLALKALSFQRTTHRRDLGGSMRFIARHLFKRTLQGANVRKVAVFFSNGQSEFPDLIDTAVLELSALDIQPAVISFKNIPKVNHAFALDKTGQFQVINIHQESDYVSALKRLQACVICYDKCRPDELCFRTAASQPQAYMDAAFILESSREISTSTFEQIKYFLSTALDNFDISTDPKTSSTGDRIAVVSHAHPNFQPQRAVSPVKIEFDFVTYRNKRQMKRHIQESVQKLNGEAAIGHAIEWTINNVFSEAPNQRKYKAIFAISVGETSQWDKEMLRDAALRAKCLGYALFVLSIGREYNIIELMELASMPLEHHMVQLGRIHKAEFEYAVKFLKPFIHLLKREIHRYPPAQLQRICAKINPSKPAYVPQHQRTIVPFDETAPSRVQLVDEIGSAFPEYL